MLPNRAARDAVENGCAIVDWYWEEPYEVLLGIFIVIVEKLELNGWDPLLPLEVPLLDLVLWIYSPGEQYAEHHRVVAIAPDHCFESASSRTTFLRVKV
ncbi:MAG TPA: hypothetical protein VKM54_02930 [Myxococcota bacterium]|nr:hypothetical protein [Myxococcota bacterium]